MITVEFETDTPILRTARQAVPEMSVPVENEQSPGRDDDGYIHLLFWATGGDYEAFDRALDDDPTVTAPMVLADTEHSRLYRVIFTDEGMAQTAHPVWVELNGTQLHAESSDDDDGGVDGGLNAGEREYRITACRGFWEMMFVTNMTVWDPRTGRRGSSIQVNTLITNFTDGRSDGRGNSSHAPRSAAHHR